MRDNSTKTNCITSEVDDISDDSVSKRVIFDDPLMTTAELAAYIRHKPATVMKWRKYPTIDQPPFICVRKNRILYKKSEVEKWLNRNPFIKSEGNK